MRKIIMMLGVICALGAGAAEKGFTYVDESATLEYIGNNKAETYNVAVRLYQAGFAGYRITGVSVPVGDETEVIAPQIWLSSKLETKTVDGVKQNVADLATAQAQVVERDGHKWIEGKFAQPVTVTKDGLYAGYSFTIGEKTPGNAAPVAGVKTATKDGFYLFTTRSALKWKDYTEEKQFTSAINVILEGDFPAVAITPSAAGKLYFPADSELMDIKVLLSQFGDEPLQEIAYTIQAGDKTLKGTKKFDTAVNLQFGHGIECDLQPEIQLEPGEYDLTFSVDKVNGKDNGSVASSFADGISMLRYYPVNRPLMEEFTGMWCGFCPRGWAAMKMMQEQFGDRYVCASYHIDPYDADNDPLVIMGSDDVATPVSGYPNMYINRKIETDPFLGTYPFVGGYAIDKIWEKQQAQFTPWWMDAQAYWTADGRIEVNASVANSFGNASDDFTLLYMLLEDGLHNPKWRQMNNFSGETGWEEYPYMKQFVEGGDAIFDLVFDDVLVYCENVWGIPGSLPFDIKADQLYEHKYIINPADVVNYKGESLLYNPDKLKVVVALLSAGGSEVLNSIVVPVAEGSGICASSIDSNDMVSVKYYDISGKEVNESAKGVVIRRTVDASGNVKTTKMIR